MNRCAKLLIGKHDFSSFCKGEAPNNNPQCTIFTAEWTQKTDGYCFTIQANRFLRNMVRAIVGTLVDVGLGKISEDAFRQIFAQGNRSDAGHSVPAEGLFLTKVEYPKPNQD
jgi:tRNA pseudouridine38-40 synthase